MSAASASRPAAGGADPTAGARTARILALGLAIALYGWDTVPDLPPVSSNAMAKTEMMDDLVNSAFVVAS
jgi:hypothetical protein